MDTFKSQDNEKINSLCLENNCKLVIVLHNLTNKFETLDIIQQTFVLVKTGWKRLKDVLQSCLGDVLNTSWKMKNCYTEDVFGKQEMIAGNHRPENQEVCF